MTEEHKGFIAVLFNAEHTVLVDITMVGKKLINTLMHPFKLFFNIACLHIIGLEPIIAVIVYLFIRPLGGVHIPWDTMSSVGGRYDTVKFPKPWESFSGVATELQRIFRCELGSAKRGNIEP